jgi:hypothetical protein
MSDKKSKSFFCPISIKIMAIINVTQRENAGGWSNIQLATLEEVAVCPAILTNSNAKNVSIIGDSDTIDVVLSLETIVVNVTPKKTTSGVVYKIAISCSFDSQNETVDSYFHKFNHKKIMVVGLNNNNQTKIFGSKLHPLSFSYQEIHGKNLEDATTTRVSIGATIPQKPVYI